MNHTVVNSPEFLGIPAAAIPGLVKDFNALNYNFVASFVLFFWDILLTLDQELTYLWKSKFSYIVVLFGVIRILFVAIQFENLAFSLGIVSITNIGCKIFLSFAAVLGLIMTTCVDILLIFRVYALYGRNKALLRFLCILEVAAFIAVACLIVIALPNIQDAANPIPHKLRVGNCLVLSVPSIESYVWFPILIVQAVLFLLAIGRHVYLQWSGSSLTTTSHIYDIFIRDGIWVFCVLLVEFLLCIIGNKMNSILGTIGVYWTYTIIGVSTSRLILNLRSASHEKEELSLGNSLVYTRVMFVNEGAGSES